MVREAKISSFHFRCFISSPSSATVTSYSSTRRSEILTNAENEQNNHSYYVATVTTSAVEAEVSAPPLAVEVVQRTRITQFVGKSREEIAAIRIQTAFRGYMSRRSLRALRGLVRLKSLMEGSAVKCQATNTLRCMQTLARVQSQIRYRRMRMLEENHALQRQLLQKHAIELEKLRIGNGWEDSIQSKEQVEAGLLSKHEKRTCTRLCILSPAKPEELFEILEPDVCGSRQSHLGLELAGKMDGSPTMGEPKHNGEGPQRHFIYKEFKPKPCWRRNQQGLMLVSNSTLTRNLHRPTRNQLGPPSPDPLPLLPSRLL